MPDFGAPFSRRSPRLPSAIRQIVERSRSLCLVLVLLDYPDLAAAFTSRRSFTMKLVTVRALAKILVGGAWAASLCGVFSSIAAAQAPASFVYVANNDSTVSTYSVDAATGSLTDAGVALIGPMSSSFSLGLSPSQTLLYVGDNTGAGTWGFAIDANSGALTPLAGSPFPVPDALSFAVDPAGGFFVAAGAGGVSSYRI